MYFYKVPLSLKEMHQLQLSHLPIIDSLEGKTVKYYPYGKKGISFSTLPVAEVANIIDAPGEEYRAVYVAGLKKNERGKYELLHGRTAFFQNGNMLVNVCQLNRTLLRNLREYRH